MRSVEHPGDEAFLELSRAESLVLFEFLYRFNENIGRKGFLADQAEQKVLWMTRRPLGIQLS